MSDRLIRPITRADARAVNDLLAAAEAVDRTGEHYSVEDVLEDLANPMVDPARDWLLVEEEGQVVAHSRLLPRAPTADAIRISIDGTVHPAHRRSGVGSCLLPVMLARAEAHVRERGTGLRAIVTTDGPSADPGFEKLMAAQGLRPEQWMFVMSADLAAVAGSAPGLPEGYTVHTWEGIDHDEIRSVHNRAFVDHHGFSAWDSEMWRQWVSGSRAFRPALSLLARDRDGAIAAYVQTGEYDAVKAVTGVREAYVAKVGTSPEHRRRGVAGLLLRRAMVGYRDAGFDRAGLDVDAENPTGALGIYERAGFLTQVRRTSYGFPEPAGGPVGG